MSLARRIRFSLLCFALMLPSRSFADDVPRDWWGELRKASAACFGGRSIKVTVVTGAGSRTLGEVARSGPFGEIRLTIPLYNKRQRQEERQKRGAFLEHAAEILRELREAQARIEVKREQAEVVKEALIQEGLSGIESFFRIREEVAALEAVVSASEKKLTGHIIACGGK